MIDPIPSESNRIPSRFWRLRTLQLVVIDLMDWLFPFAAVNLCWVVCSLTLIGLPPATAALFDLAHRAYQGDAPSVRRFFAALRRWAVVSWVWAGANLALILLALWLASRLRDASVLMALPLAAAALILLSQCYVLPFLNLQDQPRVGQAIRNSIYTALGDPLFWAFIVGMSAFVLVTSVIVVAPLLLIAPVAIALFVTYSLIAWLRRRGLLDVPDREL
jgi:uncharacterized membrane protein YesL